MGSSSFGSKVTSSTRRHSFSKMTLWCFGAAATASNAGSQVDGSKSARLSVMLPSSVQFNGLNSIAQPDLGDVGFTPKSRHSLITAISVSAVCQKRTYAVQQLTLYPAPHPHDVVVIYRPELATHFCFF